MSRECVGMLCPYLEFESGARLQMETHSNTSSLVDLKASLSFTVKSSMWTTLLSSSISTSASVAH